jgi:uridine phosphorylase
MEEAMFMINPEDVRDNAIANGLNPKAIQVPGAVLLTFNRPIVDVLSELCNLKDWDWEARKFTPYCTAQKCMKGAYGELEIAVFVPPMGASPLAAFCEELVYFGARRIFLLCASWSLGEKYLKKGQIHLPNFAIGLDGTSYHYDNDEFMVSAEPGILNALEIALERSGADWRRGGVGCCEALYRITPEMVADYQKKGCLSMENGEVAALYSIAKTHEIRAGVLLQPYIDLEKGYDSSYTGEKYEETCRLQALVAVKTLANS